MRSRLIVGVLLAAGVCLAIDSLWAQRPSRRNSQQNDTTQTDATQADPNQDPNQDPNKPAEEEAPVPKLPDDPKLVQVYEQFVLNAEKLAAQYIKNDDYDKARACYEEIVRLVPSYSKGKTGLEDIKQRQATFMRADVTVYASKGWQDTGVVVAEGKTFVIHASGNWNFRLSHELNADGMEVPKELRDFNPGSLVGMIDDGNPKDAKPFFVGSDYSHTPQKAGKLFLSMYDADHTDNDGELRVVITGSFAAGGKRVGMAGASAANR